MSSNTLLRIIYFIRYILAIAFIEILIINTLWIDP